MAGSFISNEQGFLHLKMIFFFLGIIGIWYMVNSFHAGNLKTDFSAMLEDCQKISTSANLPQGDQIKMNQAFDTIKQLATKNNINNVNNLSHSLQVFGK